MQQSATKEGVRAYIQKVNRYEHLTGPISLHGCTESQVEFCKALEITKLVFESNETPDILCVKVMMCSAPKIAEMQNDKHL